MATGTQVIPHAESVGALRDLPATLELPEVRLFFFTMTDASRVLRDSDERDWYAPGLWDLVDDAVARGRETGTLVGNTSHGRDLDAMGLRVRRLVDHGVRMILIQGAPFLFQIAVGGVPARPPRRARLITACRSARWCCRPPWCGRPAR